MDLFEVKTEVTGASLRDVHYIAVSMLQKAIRMGLSADALRAARILWLENSWLLFKRLHVILGEDIGRDHEVIDWVLKFYESGRSFKCWDDVALMVVMMAESKAKSHEVHESIFCMTADGGLVPSFFSVESPLKLLTLEDIARMVPEFKVSMEEYVAIFGGLIDPTILIRLYKMLAKVDNGERQLRLYPLWLHADANKTYDTIDEVAKFPALTRKCGDILLNAVDSHTRAGKMAFSVLVKKCPIKCEYEDMRTYEWVAAASKMNAVIVDRPLIDAWMVGKEEVIGWIEAHLSDLMDVREWALKKVCPEILEVFANVEL